MQGLSHEDAAGNAPAPPPIRRRRRNYAAVCVHIPFAVHVVTACLSRRLPPGRKRDEQPLDPSQPSTSAAAAAAAGAHGGTAAAAAQHAAAATPAAAVARRLAGVRRVTLSVPGVLLEEKGAEELDESASVRQEAAGGRGRQGVGPRLLRLACSPALWWRVTPCLFHCAVVACRTPPAPVRCVAETGVPPLPSAAELVRQIVGRADCYLMCHVSDDIGEALVRGALEHAGITGSGPGQVPPHRCEQQLALRIGLLHMQHEHLPEHLPA